MMDAFLAAAALPALAAAIYLLTLTLVAGRARPRRWAPPMAAPPSFRIVVPAHNEATGIARTVASLRHIDYPGDRFRIVVVADNCTDATAENARAAGATVLERHDRSRRGKGYALAFAFEHLLAQDDAWDAVAVVDADTLVAPTLLAAFAARLADGAQAVQCTYLPTPSRGSAGVITDVAFTAFHVVRSTAREALRLSAGLRGNGMAFTRQLLSTVPHDAFSRTEDLEFGVQLGLRGLRVAYAPEATVYGDMPDDPHAVATQRSRWMGGRFEIARRHVPALLLRAVRAPDRACADLAADLLVPPLSLLVTVVAAGLAAAAAAAAPVALALWAVAAAAVAIHVFDAAHRAGRLGDLLLSGWRVAPYALGKAVIALRSIAPGSGEWVRTARAGEQR